MRIFKYLSVALLAMIEILIIFGLNVSPVMAETRVQGYIQSDTSWTAENSPYLLEDNVTVPEDVTLTIGPGVSVGVVPEVFANDVGYEPSIEVSGGRLSIQGTSKSRVSIDGIDGVFVTAGSVFNGSVDIADADFTGGAGLSFNESRGTIASSTITGASQGLYVHDSAVSIWGSRIKGNQTGIYIQPHRVFMVENDSNGPIADSDIHFGLADIQMGRQLADAPDIFASSSLTIRGSSIADNTGRAVANNGSFTVDAGSNWWGSADGPATAGANSIQGQVNDTPWLTAEPPLDGDDDPPACCSSILFLPGLEGTRLYSVVPNPVSQFIRVATMTDQLWEPHGYSNVTALYLNANGSSTDSSIYSGAPIDSALGLYGVYGKFMGFLDGLVKKGTVSEWRAFGYDWREPVAEVVAGSEKKATTTESLVETVADLAAGSKTGKVTIVAHSNGGLMAKDLVKTLADSGKSNLIDSVISVAVPYLGTPAAIPKMLNGYDESIAYGLIATADNMRGLGANMPSAYSLLPSRGFFSSVADAFKPTIAFASTTMNSFDAQSAFIADASNAHQVVPPSSSDITLPIRGNRLLMAAADAIHGLLDPFVWPTAIARWAIVGWNSETPKETSYSSSGYTVSNTIAGDGTVIAPSADYNAGQTISVDLKTQSAIEKQDITHGDILEASATESAVGSIVSNPTSANPAVANTKVLDQISQLPGVTVGSLDWAHIDDNRRDLEISTHSPVALNIYDGEGRHTGEIPMPAQLVGKVEDGFYTFYENKIPGSSFNQPGGNDNHPNESVTVPDDGGKYTVVVNGTAAGSFELDIDRIYATTTVDSVSWKGMPVDSLTVATTTIISGGDPMISNLASSTSALSLDINGDGTVDATSSPNTAQNTDQILTMLEKSCDALDHNGSRGKSCVSRLEHARGAWKSWQGKNSVASHQIDFEGIGGSVGHLKLKGMSASDKDRVWNGLDAFVKQFE